MDTHCRNFLCKIAAESGRSGQPILLPEPASITYSLRSKFSEICERCRLTRIAPNAAERSTEAHAEVVRPSDSTELVEVSRRGRSTELTPRSATKISDGFRDEVLALK